MQELPAGTVSGAVLDDDRTVVAGTKKSLAAANLGEIDEGASRALLALAAEVDSIVKTGFNRAGKFDNTVIPTYLRYCEALGLTPSGRGGAVKPAGESKPSTLQQMRDRHLNAVS